MSSRPRFDLRHLHCFVAVAEEGSFRGAARRLNMAQPSVSRTIRDLEAAVGAELFARAGRRPVRTAAGDAMLAGARRVLAQGVRLAEEMAELREGRSGRIRIAHTDTAIGGSAPGLVAAFREEAAGVAVGFEPMVTVRQLAALAEGRIDLGLATGPVTVPGIEAVEIERQAFRVVLPSRHPLARREVVEPAALAAEPFVMGRADSWSHFNAHVVAFCHAAGFVPRPAMEGMDGHAILGMVAAGMGITLSVDTLLTGALPDVAVRPLTGAGPILPTVAVWPAATTNAALLRLVARLRSA